MATEFASFGPLFRRVLIALPLLLSSFAARPSGAQEKQRNQAPASFTVISPVFGQLLSHSQPSSFAPASENANATNYLRESVLKGETVGQWTQMITVTGVKGLASSPNMTPSAFVGRIANGLKKACPDTFSAIGLGEFVVTGHKAFAAVASCGTVGAGGARSESALIVAIQGASDVYSIQWAERAPPSGQTPSIDKGVWSKRLAQLGPIRLCPIVPGEKAPYPSCTSPR